MKQWAFHMNIGLCTGCKACQVACKDKISSLDLPCGSPGALRPGRMVQHGMDNWTVGSRVHAPHHLRFRRGRHFGAPINSEQGKHPN
jgi:Fe-S-cluster-containing dehydrogenase component